MGNENIKYNVLRIIRGTTVDGPGFRTAIYLAGCVHQCPECHNPQSWNPHSGNEMTLEELMKIVEEEDFDVTLSGGDPLYNPESTAILVNALKKQKRNVWVYTGFSWEEILADPKLINSIKEADVVVEGRFINNLKDPDLPFRGSSNQRILDISQSLKSSEPIWYESKK